MTSASELFHNWRNRAGRSPNPHQDLGSLGLGSSNPHQSSSDPLRRRPVRSRALRRLHARDAAGASPQATRHHQLCHRPFHRGRELVQLDSSGPNDAGTGNSRVDRSTLARNDRLPGSVLQARERLLERLRGISRTVNRQNVTMSPILWDEFAVSDDFRIINSEDHESEVPSEWFESSVRFDLASEVSQGLSLQDASKKKPPGLTWEAICSLPHELFRGGEENGVTSASLECSICLERFWEGDKLIRLVCDHWFHPDCLGPWVRTCGDCPYCRASI